MNITAAQLLLLQGKSAFTHGTFRPLVLALHTDEGLTGYGELSMAIGSSQREAVGAVRDLVELIRGEDFRDTTRLWNRLARENLWASSGGCPLYAAISAIDMALWDLKGKWLEVPLFQLLGGKCQDSVSCYASQLQFGWQSEKAVRPDDLAQQAAAAVQEGYRWLKLDPIGYSDRGVWKGWSLSGILEPRILQTARDRMAAVRQAVGEEIGLIVENHCLTDAVSALDLIRVLEPLNISLYEEVTAPDHLDALETVRSRAGAHLSGGEKLTARSGFLPYLTRRLLDVIQPDLGVCGGVSEVMSICAMAQVYDIQVSLHTCHSPISIAASLQVEAALPNLFLHEVHKTAVLEENVALGAIPLRPHGGAYAIPEGPGIGQEPSEWALRNCEQISI